MAQVKPLIIDATLGVDKELDTSTADITLQSYTANSGGSFSVVNGVAVDTNITFNGVTDTIAGIQNQNLLDKSAAESISGVFTFTSSPIVPTPTGGTDAANKDYVDNRFNGNDWQESVLDIQVDATLDPGASPATGARYILTNTAALNANFGSISGVGDGDIVEYNGADFEVVYDVSINTEGGSTWVEDANRIYRYNGTAWVDGGATTDHNTLSGLQGGAASEYYHFTSAQHTQFTSNTLTASRLTQTDGSNNVASVGDLTNFIAGTTNQITVTDDADGTVTLSTPQDLHTGANVTFNQATLTNLIVGGSTALTSVSTGAADNDKAVTKGYVDDQVGAANPTTTYTAGAGGVAQYDVVYISGNDTILKANANSASTSNIIGITQTAAGVGVNTEVQTSGVLAGAISGLGASAGDRVFLATTAGLMTTTPPGTGNSRVQIGYAKNATDLQIQIQFYASA